ncbi:fibronectin type III domain-containing protein [Pedococcus dokdonensis]|uniref:fibronectin type III domain-containing protein n=1 Tax=Pedococcus dokdonensis TaxID=443156 RepID=UPI0012FD59B2|nr:fibronectin type III domain-containing protein [Pedococcus dokdonensis]
MALVAAAACVGITAAGPASAESAPSTAAGVAPSSTTPAGTPAVTPVADPPAAPAEAAPSTEVEPAPPIETVTEPVTTPPAVTAPVATPPVATQPAATQSVAPAQTAPSRRAAATSRTAVAPASTAPVVTTQPVETWVDLGESATFTAHASGTPVPTVQWQFRRWTEDTWVDIPGATSDSYTSPPASLADVEPGYRAVFTNSAGSVATQSADLRMNQLPPAPGTPSAPRNVIAHQTAPGQITITWSAPADEGDSPITSYGAGYATRRWGNGDDFSPSTYKAVFNDIEDGDYSAVVFAVNDAGMGWRVFVPISVGDGPSAARHVAATRSGSAVTVTWGAPSRVGYGPVDGYDVVLTSGAHRVTRTLPAGATSATFRDLAPGTWRVTVTASNVVGPGVATTVTVVVPSSTPAAPSRPAPRPVAAAIPAAIPAAYPAQAPTAQLALTGSAGAAQAALALGLLLLGLASTTAARRLRTVSRH